MSGCTASLTFRCLLANHGRPKRECSVDGSERSGSRAKADIDGLKKNYHYRVPDVNSRGCYFLCYAEFIVNSEKRTVVVLLRGVDSHEIFARGIAKAAPDDCFNVWLGKAIALHRALGLEVPDEYLNTPQPTEVRVGDVVHNLSFGYTKTVSEIRDERIIYENAKWCDQIRHVSEGRIKIIDDSRTEVI